MLALFLLLPALAPAQDGEEPPPSYEFLSRQADLLFQYKKYDAAADSLVQACATDEGKISRSCHSRLANAAEKAGRVGLAIHAWELASVLGDEAQEESRVELERLYSTYGRLLLYPPEGRSLPTRPLDLAHTGFLIDPKQKETLKALIDRTSRKGLTESTVWLPFGTYSLGRHTFEVTAGEACALVLDPEDVPYQTGALRGERSGFVPLAGPRELVIALAAGVLGVPTEGVGAHPARIGAQLSLGGHLGPVRLEGRVRASSVRSQSPTAPDRRAEDIEVLAGVDVGVDVRLGGSAWLTPHLSLLGGRLGAAVTSCVAVQPATGHRWTGECSLSGAGGGGALGVDLLVLPAGDPRRVGIRVGLAFEALGGHLEQADGAPLIGLGTVLESAAPRGYLRLGGGLDVGLALRF